MKKAEIKAEYLRLIKVAAPVQQCCYCLIRAAKSQLEPHHPNGRHGLNLLDFKWTHATCHRTAANSIHNRPALAKALGLYHPEKGGS